METIMPSEIARLVYGYLIDEGCEEAARLFLGSSPNLIECRMLASRGKIFTTRIGEMCLLELMDKYCTASIMLHEKLNQNSNGEVKKTSDIVEQLKYLFDGAKSQKIVVNINVPSQNGPQASRYSPIILTHNRKRRHINTAERERYKRTKCDESGKLPEDFSSQSSETPEATRLENLPGHVDPTKSVGSSPYKPKDPLPNLFEKAGLSPIQQTGCHSKENVSTKSLEYAKSTMATDTSELLHTSSTEVQTDLLYGTGLSFGPSIECFGNLSAMRDEMLLNTTFQENFAQSINTALAVPSDGNTTLSKELGFHMPILIETINRDPVLEEMLKDIVGVCSSENTPSPEKEGEQGKKGVSDKSQEIPKPGETKNDNAAAANALDDQNAAAINGIMMIKANIAKEANSTEIEKVSNTENPTEFSDPAVSNHEKPEPDIVSESQPEADPACDEKVSEDSTEPKKPKSRKKNIPKSCGNVNGESQNKITNKQVKKTRKPYTSQGKKGTPMELVEPEVTCPTVTTLVVSEDQTLQLPLSRRPGRYIPILPKDPNNPPPLSIKPICLKTVMVPAKNVPSQVATMNALSLSPAPLLSCQTVVQQVIEAPIVEANIMPSSSAIDSPMKETAPPKETPETLPSTNMPIISLDASISFGDLGMSPGVKIGCNVPEKSDANVEKSNSQTDQVLSSRNSWVNQSKDDLLVKRTPRSILKSRSKSHRFSSSTPRRRSSHIRALSFNTPHKSMSVGKKSVEDSRPRNIACRTSLFKSPPMLGNQPLSPVVEVKKSPVLNVPTETMSPAPKLEGNWDKFTGLGAILGATSTSSSSLSPVASKTLDKVSSPSGKKTWDMDLRLSLSMGEEEQLKALTAKASQGNASMKEEEKKKKRSDDESKVRDESGEEQKVGDKKDDQVSPKNAVEDKETPPGSVSCSEGKNPVKKYAKIKTLTSNVGKVLTKNVESLKKMEETPAKNSGEMNSFGCKLSMMDLETPQKDFMSEIPATPRVVDFPPPDNSLLLLSISKTSSECLKIFGPSGIPELTPLKPMLSPLRLTPGPPPTPGNNLFGDCNSVSRDYKVPMYFADRAKGSQELKPNVTNSQPNSEIADFEVVKENLTSEEAAKELKISVTSKESEDVGMETSASSIVYKTKTEVTVVKDTSYRTNSSEDDSDSDGSVASSGSNSSNLSDSSSGSGSDLACSTCMDTPLKQPTSTKKKGSSVKKTLSKDCLRHNNSSSFTVQGMTPSKSLEHSKLEKLKEAGRITKQVSPAKVFPLKKTVEAEKATENETPAKDESLLSEAKIIETPSSSNPGCDTVTNLSSKISAAIDSEKIEKTKSKAKPVILSNENVSLPSYSRLVTKANPEIVKMPMKQEHLELKAELEEKLKNTRNKLKLAPPVKKTTRKQSTISKFKNALNPSSKLSNNPKSETRKPKEVAEKISNDKFSRNENPIVESSPKITGEVGTYKNERKSKDEKLSSTEVVGFDLKKEGKNAKSAETHESNEAEDEMSSNDKKPTSEKSPMENLGGQKTKVELVKRDLFNKDAKMTTRSKTRQIMDVQDTAVSTSSDKQDAPEIKDPQEGSNSEFPKVLGALELRPTNKSENLPSNVFEFVFDIKHRTKKKPAKYSDADLQIALTMTDVDGEPFQHVLTSTSFVEIFSIDPVKKRPARKEPMEKGTKKPRKGASKMETFPNDDPMEPLSTSTPIIKDASSKSGHSEAGAASGNALDSKESDEVVEPKKNATKRKKKTSTKEEECASNEKTEDVLQEKKKGTLGIPENVLTAMSNHNLESFISSVHGAAN